MNWIGLRTLFSKEVRRFLKVPGQTLAQPVVMTSLYFLVFGYSLGSRLGSGGAGYGGVPYARFIVPGLVMLALIQNSFMNSSSSMFVLKLQGTIVDLLVAPLSVAELVIAFAAAAAARGLLVGFIVWLVSAVFTGAEVAHVGFALAFSVVVATTFGLIGMAAAIWSEKFEQLNIVPTFILTPLTFLGGVFYAVSSLPEPWRSVSRANPILYMVEGLRYGLLGVSSTDPYVGLALTLTLCLFALGAASWMLATGYKLRK
jgi:ABC-2 type transport system permease protein